MPVTGFRSLEGMIRGHSARSRLWLAFLAGGAAVLATLQLTDSTAVEVVVFSVVSLAAAAAIVIGVRLHTPVRSLPWYLLAFGQLLAAVNWVIWKGHLALFGSIPAPGRPADWFWFASSGLLIAALLLLLRSREPGAGASIEAAVIAVASFLIAWQFLVSGYAHEEQLPVVWRAVQSGFALADVTVLALVARLLVAPSRRTPAYTLLIGGSLALLGADLAWNWLLLGEAYVPGAW